VSTTRVPTWPAAVYYESNRLTQPLQSSPPPLWTDDSNRFIGAWGTTHGTDFELDRVMAGEFHPVVDNRDGAFDPTNTLSPLTGVAPYNGLRIRTRWSPNELGADQATAGEQTGFLGAVPTRLNVTSDASSANFGIVTSGSAFQGTQVYQASLLSGATVGACPLRVLSQPCVPGRVYSYQAQVRITAGNSVSTQAAILFYNQAGTQVGSATGTAQTITSGSATWVQLAASGTAPAGAISAKLLVQIASGTLNATTTWQLDGLQFENSPYPTTWQQPGTVGANLLPRVIATGTAAMDAIHDSVGNWFYSSGSGTLAQANYLTAAPPGQTSALGWTTPSGTTSSNAVLYVGVNTATPTGPAADCVQVTATTQYTASAYLSRTSSADATVQVTASINWFSATGAPLGSSNGAAVTVAAGSWVRATVTGTAPAGAVWGRISAAITTPASTTASNTIYVTGLQFEQAGAASTWVDPGPTLFLWWGYWEQLPQQWRLSGTWGELDAVGVDALAGLAQFQVISPFVHEILILNPSFLYVLDDPAGSAQVADTAGKVPAAAITNSPYGTGSVTLGNAVTSTSPAFGFVGGPGPVATFGNTTSGSPQSALTYLALTPSATTPNYAATSSTTCTTAFTRMIAFRCPAAPAANLHLWTALTGSAYPNFRGIDFYIDSSGHLNIEVGGDISFTQTYSSQSYADGNWHLATVGVDLATGHPTFSIDGVATVYSSGASTLPYELVVDSVGAWVQTDKSLYTGGANADIAFVAQFPAQLTPAQITNLYNSWRTASSGESSGARAARLLSWMQYPGATSIDAGATQSMGPANDLNGGTGLDGLYAIATTEAGDAYASNAGVVTFKARTALYNQQPLFVFGENQAAGEWPYEDVVLPVDPLHTYNVVNVTQWSAATGTLLNGYTVSGQVATAQDAASQQANFQRTAPPVTVNSTSFAEVQASAQYRLQRYKLNRMRSKTLKLHAAAIPGLFRVCAQLEKGVRIRVMKRPPWRSSSNPIQFDGFVTKTAWAIDPKPGGGGMDAFLIVEAAPADLNNYWVLAPLHTTLAAQAASGQNKATIAALPDAAYNTLSQSLPQGYQLTFDPGTAIAETMTIAPGGIPATSLGYASAQLTFTANFQFTHQSGAVVCEPLPAGYTDPTAWDSNSQLGASSAAILSGGAAGNNTVTVGPLPDSATNPLGSNWTTGDQVTLSPAGTPETMTIQSVAPTIPGYTSCQITFTANLAHTHTDTVCDPLPAGVTSPPTGTCRATY
jgi:hypothetical protein